MTTTTKKLTNKQISQKIARGRTANNFSNPIYSVTDHKKLNCVETEKSFRSHEEAKQEQLKYGGEYIYLNDSGFGLGKYKYLVKEYKPTVHEFKSEAQARKFILENPEVINSHL